MLHRKSTYESPEVFILATKPFPLSIKASQRYYSSAGFEKSSQTEQHEVQNQNDATKAHPKGKSESHPLKHHKDPAASSLAERCVVGMDDGVFTANDSGGISAPNCRVA